MTDELPIIPLSTQILEPIFSRAVLERTFLEEDTLCVSEHPEAACVLEGILDELLWGPAQALSSRLLETPESAEASAYLHGRSIIQKFGLSKALQVTD